MIPGRPKKRVLRRKRPLLRRRKNPVKRMLSHLPNLLRLVYRLFTDARVSILDRALFATVIAYVLSPFDLLPDWLGMFGLTDDFYLIGLSLSRLLKRASPDILLEYWQGSPKALGWLIESIEDVGAKLPRTVRSLLRNMVRR
jgi:uncharacterized membrane protein YkvA (DUF1232 family)